MVGVKKGALNFSKMLRTLGHRTNQVKDFNFLRRPLQRPSKATTLDRNKDGVRDERFYGPPVDFGYSDSKNTGSTVPDLSKDNVYYETTWGLHFQNLKALQNPKISLNNEVTTTGSRTTGNSDFYVPSYDILKNKEGFGGSQSTTEGTRGIVGFGHFSESAEQGAFGTHSFVGTCVTNSSTVSLAQGLTTFKTTPATQFVIMHYNNHRDYDTISGSSEDTTSRHWPTESVFEGVAKEIKVGDVIMVDSPESRAMLGSRGETNNKVGDIAKGSEIQLYMKPRIDESEYSDTDGDFSLSDEKGSDPYIQHYIRVPEDGSTIQIIDGAGKSITFEFDFANNGATGSNTAVVPSAQTCIDYAYALVTAINSSALKIIARNYDPTYTNDIENNPYTSLGVINSDGVRVKRTNNIHLQQDICGTIGDTTITFNNNTTYRHFGKDNEGTTKINLTTREFTGYHPEQLLITSVKHHGSAHESWTSESSIDNATAVTWEAAKYSSFTVIRGYNNTYSTPHSRIGIENDFVYHNDFADYIKGTADQNIYQSDGVGGWSNHEPFAYLVKRGNAFAILDVQNSGVADETITLISSDGTSKTYTCKATADYANNQWSRGGTDHGVASFKAAVEHASGHNGKIEVELKSYTGAQNPWTVILKQATSGTAGNTTITEGVSGWTITSQFAGGLADTNTLENGTTLTIKDAEGNSHTFTTDNTLKEWESTSTKIGTNLTCQNPAMWSYSLAVAIKKAARADLTYLKGLVQSNINEDGSSIVELLEATYPLAGSEETAKINVGYVPYNNLSSWTYNMSNGKEGLFAYEFNYSDYSGYAQYNKLGEDLYNDWSNRTMSDGDITRQRDASGVLFNTFELSVLIQAGAFTIHQNSIGESGNTEITGNSPCFANVGNWWSGTLSGHPGEQANRSFYNGQSFKGKFIQTRLNDTHYQGPRQNHPDNYKIVEPYFYEFLSGDLIQDTSHVIFSGTDVLNCYPKNNGMNRTETQATTIGFSFQDAGLAEGSYLSGVEADRIKFTVSLSTGQEDQRNAEQIGSGRALGSWRSWNQYRGQGGETVTVDGAKLDNSVDFRELEFIYTLDNILYKNVINFGGGSDSYAKSYFNMVPGESYQFDLPLDKNNSEIYYLYSPVNWYDPETADEKPKNADGTEKDYPQPNSVGTGNVETYRTGGDDDQISNTLHDDVKGDLTPGKNFFPLWINGRHYIAEMRRGTHGRTIPTDGSMLDVSTGTTYLYGPDSKKLATPNYSMRRCIGQKGSCLGRDGQGFDRLADTQDHGGYLTARPKGGWNDIQFVDRNGFNHKVKMDFKDIKIYKPKTWRIESAREYDSEYIKLSCRRMGQDDNSFKRRAYGK